MEAKKNRTTTRAQFAAMIDAMKKNADIAKNMTKKPPDVILKFWDSLAAELNALGPPCKNVYEWKKVWSDYKSAIKKKLAHNRREQNATGGGTYKQLFLSTMEEEVAELICLQTYVQGTANVASYGAPVRAECTEEVLPSPSNHAEPVVAVEEEAGGPNVGENSGGEMRSTSVGRRRQVPNQTQLLEKQISLHEAHLKTVSILTEETNNNLKKINRSLDKLHDDLKTSNDLYKTMINLFKTFIEETKTHNTIMQQMALEKTLNLN